MSQSIDIDEASPYFLKNLERHLVELAEDTAQISTTVSEIVAGLSSTLNPATIRDLQKLDNLQQSLTDAATLCSALAGPNELRDEALNMLKLKATRSLVQNIPTERCKSSGSVDIF